MNNHEINNCGLKPATIHLNGGNVAQYIREQAQATVDPPVQSPVDPVEVSSSVPASPNQS